MKTRSLLHLQYFSSHNSLKFINFSFFSASLADSEENIFKLMTQKEATKIEIRDV